MDTATLAIALPKILKVVNTAIKKDRAQAYGLKEDWTLPALSRDRLAPLGLFPPDVATDAFDIVDGVVTVLAYPTSSENCDGCSLAPDELPKTFGGIKFLVGALFHDAWYRDLEVLTYFFRLAEPAEPGLKAGWTTKKVRKLGDMIFAGVLNALVEQELTGFQKWLGRQWVKVYYWAVRVFGGLYHKPSQAFAPTAVRPAVRPAVRVLVIALSLSVSVAGCGGCAAPQPFADPSALTMPKYEHIDADHEPSAAVELFFAQSALPAEAESDEFYEAEVAQ